MNQLSTGFRVSAGGTFCDTDSSSSACWSDGRCSDRTHGAVGSFAPDPDHPHPPHRFRHHHAPRHPCPFPSVDHDPCATTGAGFPAVPYAQRPSPLGPSCRHHLRHRSIGHLRPPPVSYWHRSPSHPGCPYRTSSAEIDSPGTEKQQRNASTSSVRASFRAVARRGLASAYLLSSNFRGR